MASHRLRLTRRSSAGECVTCWPAREYPVWLPTALVLRALIVAYTDDAGIQTGKKFAEAGLQIAAGVPLMCDEPEDFRTFRLGLFGLDKLANIDRTVASLEQAIDEVVVA